MGDVFKSCESTEDIEITSCQQESILNQSGEENVSTTINSIKKTWISYIRTHCKTMAMMYLLHIFVASYVGLAIHFWNENGRCTIDWCNGLGMLIIILSFIYGGLIYYQIIKKYFGQFLYQNIIHPVHLWWKNQLKQRHVRFAAYSLPAGVALIFLIFDTEGHSERLKSTLGMTVILLLGFIFSRYPGKIKWQPVMWGLGIQFLLGLLIIRWSVGRFIFQCIGEKAATFLRYGNEGARFVYGHQLIDNGVFAFQALAVIFFLSFIVQILYYFGAMQWLVLKLGWVLQISMGTTVCESVHAAASIFLGMSESTLLFKPYIKDLTKSELHAIMTEGFATVAGSVLAAYISFNIEPAHLITASVMSAPAALCYSKLFYPETEQSKNRVNNMVLEQSNDNSVLDAATRGALSAIELVLGIIATIVAFVSFTAFLNGVISWLGVLVGLDDLSFEYVLSRIFIPLAWLMGVEWEQCGEVAELIGLKTVVNEFVAYQQLGKLKIAGKLSPRSEMIATYALCGFSNPGALGILVGVLATVAPMQRSAVTEIALRAWIAGSATCFLTACIAGMLTTEENLLQTISTSTNISAVQ
ncbi:hypothetical protein L9F63_002311 [Diploptera punctata]|uniref:Sodium/nucleoside cotransporter n=1 Tax=Diploptera punctata TaxID=6984 RepID=A0AAD8A2E5_DIPPU|nr:hypothetical protein L9F63_002311 [Diploptera punctata]